MPWKFRRRPLFLTVPRPDPSGRKKADSRKAVRRQTGCVSPVRSGGAAITAKKGRLPPCRRCRVRKASRRITERCRRNGFRGHNPFCHDAHLLIYNLNLLYPAIPKCQAFMRFGPSVSLRSYAVSSSSTARMTSSGSSFFSIRTATAGRWPALMLQRFLYLAASASALCGSSVSL